MVLNHMSLSLTTFSDVTDDTYRNLLIVHALCGAGDLLVHCSLESAISYLSAMQEKHHIVLGGKLYLFSPIRD